MARQSCAVCAWRETCAKRFSVTDGGAHCPDYSRDVSIKDADQESASTPTNNPTKETQKQ